MILIIVAFANKLPIKHAYNLPSILRYSMLIADQNILGSNKGNTIFNL